MIENKHYIKKLTDLWKHSGVNDGDMLLVHSNIKRTLLNARNRGIKLTPRDILQSFINAIGNEGTLFKVKK
jgi:aminoglycoside 3-N-acetyltransferase